MSLELFNGADPSAILAALYQDCAPEQVLSLQFRSPAPEPHSLSEQEQWQRIRSILSCRTSCADVEWPILSSDVPARFHYATGLETIGTLANLLMRGGIHSKFVDSYETALAKSRAFLDDAFLRCYDHAEAYSSREPWCDWFVGESILDETVLLGNNGDWWLLAVTGTD